MLITINNSSFSSVDSDEDDEEEESHSSREVLSILHFPFYISPLSSKWWKLFAADLFFECTWRYVVEDIYCVCIADLCRSIENKSKHIYDHIKWTDCFAVFNGTWCCTRLPGEGAIWSNRKWHSWVCFLLESKARQIAFHTYMYIVLVTNDLVIFFSL